MKFYKEIVRKYYKIVEQIFESPILTANGTMGGDNFACNQSSVYSNEYAYKAFDGNSESHWHSGDNASLPHWLAWYNPKPIKINHLTLIVGHSSSYPDLPNNYQIQNSNDGTTWNTVYSGVNSSSTVPTTLNIDLSNVENNEANYWRYVVTSVKGRSYGNCRVIDMDAVTKELIESDESDYDFYKDVEVQKVIQKNVRKYYNYVDEPFVQPYLTSNGTMGGDKFAASAITEYSSSYQAYMAFDNSTSTEWASKGTQNPSWISFYNPEPLKVTKLTMRNRTSAENFTAGKIYGSNNNYYWEEIGSYSTTVTSANATWEIDLSNNTKYYKYYKIVGTSMTGTNQGFTNIAITAVYQNPVAEPSSFQPEFIERKYYKYDTANPVSNVNITGTLTNDNGVLSGFSSGNFAKLPNIFSHGSKPWEVQFKVTTGSNVSSQSCIYEQLYDGNVYYGLTLYIENNTLRVRCGNGSTFWNVNTDYSISVNTTYWVKAEFTGTQYILSASIDGENWITASTINSTTIATDNYSMYIGKRSYSSQPSQWLGSIDLKESYIKVNDSILWEGVTYPVIDGTEQDFDFYKDVYNYEFYKDLDVYYAFRSYEKGEQYYGN